MADLRVDDTVLAGCEARLSRLQREFRHLDRRRDDLRAAWGSGAVAGAVDEFVDNWAHFRARLLDGIETVGTLVADARAVFDRTDGRLAGAAR